MIPTGHKLWKFDNYEKFLEVRLKLFWKHI